MSDSFSLEPVARPLFGVGLAPEDVPQFQQPIDDIVVPQASGKGKRKDISDSELSSSSDSEHARRKRRKQKKKEKREKKREKKEKKKRTASDINKAIKLEQKHMVDNRAGSKGIWLTNDLIEKKMMYYINATPDMNNLSFGYLYGADIPIYQPLNACLGLKNEKLRITKDGYFIYNPNSKRKQNESRYLRSGFDTKEKTLDLSHRKIGRGIKTLPGQEFVPLGGDEEAEGETLEELLQRRTGDLNERTKREPNNVRLWEEYAQFQDSYLQLGKMVEKKSILEKKVMILEKGLEYNPDSEDLLLLLLRTAQELYDSAKVQAMWEAQISKIEYGSGGTTGPRLWKEYIAWCQSNFQTFRVTEMRETFARALRTLNRKKENIFSSRYTKDPLGAVAEIETILLSLFSRACEFERQAGYSERSIALYQALIEFNCFCPTQLLDHRTQISAFEAFWNSEAPRIGDPLAIGWAQWHLQQTTQAAVVARDIEEESSEPNPATATPSLSQPMTTVEQAETRVFAEWFQEEVLAERPLPQRITSEVDLDEDLDRVVLADDVLPYLFQFSSPQSRVDLIVKFLEMLGVEDLPMRHSSGSSLNRSRDRERSSVGSLFRLLPGQTLPAVEMGAELRNFIRRLFHRSLEAFPKNTDLAIGYIHFEQSFSPIRAKELAKKLLKQDQMNLRLWHSYAKLEIATGYLAEAKKVYETAVSNFDRLEAAKKQEAFLLFKALAHMELSNPNRAIPVRILVSATEGKYVRGTDSVTPERVESSLAKYRELCELQPNRHVAVCRALLTYLHAGLPAAQSVFEELLQDARMSPLENEKLTLDYVRFLLLPDSGLAPKELRRVLETALSLYPLNPTLLSHFLISEANSQIFSRLRRFFDQACTQQNSILLWLFAIKIEEAKLGTAGRIRTLLEKALSHPDTQSSPLLWSYYVEFEMKHNTAQAPAVFVRAIRNVPWCKAMYMKAFSSLRATLSKEELQDYASLMVKKEIRLHKPFDFA